MIEHGFTRTSVITRLRHGPLGAHLDVLATTLHQQGYAPDSIRRTLRAGEQFGQWLAQHGHAIAEVDDALVARYLQTLPRPWADRWPKAAAGLPHLLRLWRQQGLLPSRVIRSNRIFQFFNTVERSIEGFQTPSAPCLNTLWTSVL